MNILSYTFDEYLDKVRAFHGNTAPGVVLGGVMVDLARRHIPDNILFDAISETDKCLPDAIQLLTPCTIGNGWMRIADNGRFALCLYDKQTGEGIRVAVDSQKIREYPELNDWFFILKPKKEQVKENILSSIERHGDRIMGVHPVKVNLASLAGKFEGHYAVCRKCGESYPSNDQGLCLVCQGRENFYSSPL